VQFSGNKIINILQKLCCRHEKAKKTWKNKGQIPGPSSMYNKSKMFPKKGISRIHKYYLKYLKESI